MIPNSVTNIAQQAFYGCLNLSGVALGDSVESIGPNAFFYCSSLAGLVFPASLTNLGQYAVGGCQSLSSVCFQGNQPTDGGGVFYFDNALSTILYVNGTAGWGTSYDGIPTGPCPTCGGGAPQLAILLSGANAILTWPASFTGFTLQSTSNLVSQVVWSNVSPLPVVVNGSNTVTNPIAPTSKFYRLSQ